MSPCEDLLLLPSIRYDMEYVVPYENKSAKSRAASAHPDDQAAQRAWLDSALTFVANCFAVQIFCSLRSSRENKYNLGFFCPWKCLNDEVHALYAISFEDNQGTENTIVTLLETVLRKPCRGITGGCE